MLKKILLISVVCLFSVTSFAGNGVKEKYQELKKVTEQKIVVMDKKLEKLSQKTSKLTGEAKIEMKKKYDELVVMKDSLKKKLADAGESTSDKWDDVKDKLEDYADTVESKIDEAI